MVKRSFDTFNTALGQDQEQSSSKRRHSMEPSISRTIYVSSFGNMQLGDHTVAQMFSPYGKIIHILNRSLSGFLFVTFSTEAEAANVKNISQTNGIFHNGSRLHIKFGKEPRSASSGASYGDNLNQISQNQPQEEPLPPGWDRAFDNNTGNYYYYNVSKNITQWEKPRMMNIHPTYSKNYPNQSFQVQNSFQQFGPADRSLFLAQLPETVNVTTLCKIGNKFGRLHSVVLQKERNIGFINFLFCEDCASMYETFQTTQLTIDGFPITLKKGKSSMLRNDVLNEVLNKKATRCLYLNLQSIDNLDHITTEEVEEVFRNWLTEYNQLESFNYNPTKKFGFVNFTNIETAIKVYNYVHRERNQILVRGKPVKVGFGTETSSGTRNPSVAQRRNFRTSDHQGGRTENRERSRQRGRSNTREAARSIYLAKVQRNATKMDVAKLGRKFGGEIESVKVLDHKSTAFLNFMDTAAAIKFKEFFHNLNLCSTPIDELDTSLVKETEKDFLKTVLSGETVCRFANDDHLSDEVTQAMTTGPITSVVNIALEGDNQDLENLEADYIMSRALDKTQDSFGDALRQDKSFLVDCGWISSALELVGKKIPYENFNISVNFANSEEVISMNQKYGLGIPEPYSKKLDLESKE
eukprot:augustus_masked-scaffold_4-processed-gene-1.33-mRNA-1 protein AED:1.00 eAED:1.00 QI:0/-1/0/0/-1/1/1/0/637